MNLFLKSALLAAAVASLCGVAQADTYTVAGTFNPGKGSSALVGGSYTGTYQFDGTTIGAFDIFMRNASGTVLAELNSANGALAVFGPTQGDPNYDALFFVSDATSLSSVLNLVFAHPFNGVGTVQGNSVAYSVATVEGFLNGRYAYTTDGVSAAAPVPEPATWGLMGLGLLGVGAVARRRKTA